MEITGRQLAQAREEELLVHELPDETLVYDLSRHEAHSLNRTAALIWRHCDGKTTPAEMAALVQQELNLPADEDLVWIALRRLAKARLLRQRVTPPADAARLSRREVMRKLGMAGGLALVTSIVAPTAAQALSCPGSGTLRSDDCVHNFNANNCPNVRCDNGGCCVNSGSVGNPHCACL
jgi:hypothetical protein